MRNGWGAELGDKKRIKDVAPPRGIPRRLPPGEKGEGTETATQRVRQALRKPVQGPVSSKRFRKKRPNQEKLGRHPARPGDD